MWDDLCRGASAAVVLVDTRRLDVSFPAVNYFENDSDVPFIVAVNLFDGRQTHPLDQVRDALGAAADRVWPSTASTQVKLHPEDTIYRVEAQLNALEPKTSNQAYAKTHSMALLNDLQQSTRSEVRIRSDDLHARYESLKVETLRGAQ